MQDLPHSLSPRPAFRRWLALSLALGLCILLVSGCPGQDGADDGQQAPPASGEQLERRDLRLGTTHTLPAHFSPFRARTALETSVARKVWDTLTGFDPSDHRPVPGLAESWEVSEDGETVSFTLREDAAFADGSPVTSSDVAASLAYAAALGPENPLAGQFYGYKNNFVEGALEVWRGESDRIPGVNTPDERTVEISLNHPNRLLPLTLSAVNFSIVPEAWVDRNLEQARQLAPYEEALAALDERNPQEPEQEEITEEYLSRSWDTLNSTGGLPPASGNFTVESAGESGVQLGVSSRAQESDRVHLTGVEIRYFESAEPLLQAFAGGGLDAVSVPARSYSRYQGGSLNLGELPPHREEQLDLLSIYYLGMNHRADPYRDVPLEDRTAYRRAYNFHMPREHWSESEFGGVHKPMSGIIPPASEHYNRNRRLNPRYTYQPGEAQDNLNQSGKPQGFYVPTHRFWFRGDDSEQDLLGRQISSELNDLAISLVVTPTPRRVYEERTEKGLSILWLERFDFPYPHPDSLLSTRFLSLLGAPRDRRQLGNLIGVSRNEYDSRIMEAREVERRAARYQIYSRLTDRLISNSDVGFLLSRGAVFWIRDNVHNLDPGRMDYGSTFPSHDLSGVWIERTAEAGGAGAGSTSGQQGGE